MANDRAVELGEVVDNEIELGEVIIDKIKNPALIAEKSDESPATSTVKLPTQLQEKRPSQSWSSPSTSPMSSMVSTPSSKTPELVMDAMLTSDDDVPVTLSKKILPMVTPRILDWLERCIEFASKLVAKTSIDSNKMLGLLTRAWPKLLLVYMIENGFEFFVTPDHNQMSKLTTDAVETALKQSGAENQEEKTHDTPVSLAEKEKSLIKLATENLPKEKDAQQILYIISKGNAFSLSVQEYEDIREIVLFKEGLLIFEYKNLFENAINRELLYSFRFAYHTLPYLHLPYHQLL